MILEKYINKKGKLLEKNKYYTKDKPIEEMPAPKYLYFPMSMHIGAPAEPAVKKGDHVQIGTVLGEKDGMISARVHSSVSGKVVDILEDGTLRGETTVVVVENDYKDDQVKYEDLPEDLDIDSFVSRIESAGITGKGGAGFPTHVKYKLEKKKAEYLLVNGAECEPFSTTDHRVMVEYAENLVEVASLISKIYSLDEVHFAIENHASDAIKAIEDAITKLGAKEIYVHKLGNRYPAGHADLQIEEVLGIEKKDHQRAGDLGVLQSNVSTLKAIYDAIFLNKSFHKRVVTVTGPLLENPKNLMIRLGTKIQEIVDYCGGLKEGPVKMISGGPMMGRPFESMDFPINKETTSLLFMPEIEKKKETPCIRCAACVNTCPMNLQPILISNAYRDREYELGKELKSDACISCGLCTYVCPANIDLLADIKSLNSKLKEDK